MTKTVTIDVSIEVRKVGPDLYQHRASDGVLSKAHPENFWREVDTHSARAIVQAIDSGAFADPLPTAEGAHIYNPRSKVHFFLTDASDRCWGSSHIFRSQLWHTPEQVESYGPFEVLYDPEKKEG